jgi:hypothetical protein
MILYFYLSNINNCIWHFYLGGEPGMNKNFVLTKNQLPAAAENIQENEHDCFCGVLTEFNFTNQHKNK